MSTGQALSRAGDPGVPEAQRGLLSPEASDDALQQVLDLVSRRFGFLFRDAWREVARAKLARRMSELALDHLRDYYYRLLYDPEGDEELALLFESLANHESYFFRDESQIAAFATEILPQVRRPGSRVRVWSAGCASGEEPYSLAIAALEAADGLDPGIEIFASDLARPPLDRARLGVYTDLALRNTSPRLRETYFMPEGEGRFRVTPPVRRLVQFGRLNLRGAVGEMPMARFDAIFCRNVLIYFGQDARRDVLALFHDRLAPGGYLFVGRSEASLDLTHLFEFANLVQDAAYQRPRA